MKFATTYQKPGYVLIITLVIITLISTLVTRSLIRSDSFLGFSGIAEHKIQARIQALSAVERVRAELSQALKEPPQKKDSAVGAGANKQPQISPEQRAVARAFSKLNRWIKVPLAEGGFDEDVTVYYYLTAEDGKFNINELYAPLIKSKKKDQAEQPTKQEKALDNKEGDELESALTLDQIASALLGRLFKQTKLNDRLVKILQERGYLFNDPSELVTFDFLQQLPRLKTPPAAAEQKEDNVALFDLFTLWTTRRDLNPWLLSVSTQKALGFTLDEKLNEQERLEFIEKHYKPQLSLRASWDEVFKPLYGVSYDKIEKFERIFSRNLAMPVLSITVSATYLGVTQRVYAILELVDQTFTVKKLYLL